MSNFSVPGCKDENLMTFDSNEHLNHSINLPDNFCYSTEDLSNMFFGLWTEWETKLPDINLEPLHWLEEISSIVSRYPNSKEWPKTIEKFISMIQDKKFFDVVQFFEYEKTDSLLSFLSASKQVNTHYRIYEKIQKDNNIELDPKKISEITTAIKNFCGESDLLDTETIDWSVPIVDVLAKQPQNLKIITNKKTLNIWKAYTAQTKNSFEVSKSPRTSDLVDFIIKLGKIFKDEEEMKSYNKCLIDSGIDICFTDKLLVQAREIFKPEELASFQKLLQLIKHAEENELTSFRGDMLFRSYYSEPDLSQMLAVFNKKTEYQKRKLWPTPLSSNAIKTLADYVHEYKLDKPKDDDLRFKLRALGPVKGNDIYIHSLVPTMNLIKKYKIDIDSAEVKNFVSATQAAVDWGSKAVDWHLQFYHAMKWYVFNPEVPIPSKKSLQKVASFIKDNMLVTTSREKIKSYDAIDALKAGESKKLPVDHLHTIGVLINDGIDLVAIKELISEIEVPSDPNNPSFFVSSNDLVFLHKITKDPNLKEQVMNRNGLTENMQKLYKTKRQNRRSGLNGRIELKHVSNFQLLRANLVVKALHTESFRKALGKLFVADIEEIHSELGGNILLNNKELKIKIADYIPEGDESFVKLNSYGLISSIAGFHNHFVFNKKNRLRDNAAAPSGYRRSGFCNDDHMLRENNSGGDVRTVFDMQFTDVVFSFVRFKLGDLNTVRINADMYWGQENDDPDQDKIPLLDLGVWDVPLPQHD
jgi:hypothetical protein